MYVCIFLKGSFVSAALRVALLAGAICTMSAASSALEKVHLMYVCMYVRMCVRMDACMQACMYVCMYVC